MILVLFVLCYGKETAEEIVIVISGQNKVTAINFKLHYDFFMDIKKSNFLEDRFELSSFSLKIYNVKAGNQTVTVITLL